MRNDKLLYHWLLIGRLASQRVQICGRQVVRKLLTGMLGPSLGSKPENLP